MDSTANITRQQHIQTTVPNHYESNIHHTPKIEHEQENSTQNIQKGAKNDSSKINSEKDVQDLVAQLNKAIQPMNTDINFGVDSQDVFYVSVIDTKTDRMIRRFPAEQAESLLPKMQEVSGTLFDAKG